MQQGWLRSFGLGAITVLALWSLVLVPTWASAQVIKIGLITATTGRFGGMGSGNKEGALLAAEEINAAGGINGQRLEIVFADDEGIPEKGSSLMRRLVDNDKVCAVVGSVVQVVSHTMAQVAESKKVPMLALVPSRKVVEGKRFVFHLAIPDDLWASYVARFVTERLKAKRLAILYTTTEYGLDLSAEMEKVLQGKGVQVLKEKFTDTDRDLTANWIRIKEWQAEAVYLIGARPEAPAIAMKNRKQLGITIPVIAASALASPGFFGLAGDAAAGTYLETYFRYGQWSPGEKRLIDAQIKKAGKPQPTTFHALGWDGVNLLARAIAKAGCAGERIRTELENIKGYAGAVADFSFSPTDHNGISLQSLSLSQLQADGTLKVAY